MRWVPVFLLLAACGGSPGSDASASTTVGAAPVASTTTVGSSTPLESDPGGQPPTSAPASMPGSVPATEPPGVQPSGFATSAALIVEPDGSECEICVWVADTADLRARGLMHVTDLGPADAMVFLYPEPHTGTYWMKDTPLPLSIAFYSPTTEFLGSFDMEPCTATPCLSYPTAADFEIAVEVPQGGLAELGMVPGSTFRLLDLPCTG